jgi:hypothetical protein
MISTHQRDEDPARGPARRGKSTLARRVADRPRETAIPVSEFVTEEAGEGGRRRGFSLEPLGGERGVPPNIELPARGGSGAKASTSRRWSGRPSP